MSNNYENVWACACGKGERILIMNHFKQKMITNYMTMYSAIYFSW
jgi:hypothetical protein